MTVTSSRVDNRLSQLRTLELMRLNAGPTGTFERTLGLLDQFGAGRFNMSNAPFAFDGRSADLTIDARLTQALQERLQQNRTAGDARRAGVTPSIPGTSSRLQPIHDDIVRAHNGDVNNPQHQAIAKQLYALIVAAGAMQAGFPEGEVKKAVAQALGIDPNNMSAEQDQAIDDVLGFAQLIMQRGGQDDQTAPYRQIGNYGRQQFGNAGPGRSGGPVQTGGGHGPTGNTYNGDSTVPTIRDNPDGSKTIGQIGSTGMSTGPHLDIRVKDANGNYVDPRPFINELQGKLLINGKDLSNDAITSGYGMRNHPVTGGHKMHHGVDYGYASGSEITYSGAGTISHRPASQTGGGGNVAEIKLPSGHTIQLLHLL